MLPIGLEYKSSGEDGSLLKLAGEESEAMAREKQERDESGD